MGIVDQIVNGTKEDSTASVGVSMDKELRAKIFKIVGDAHAKGNSANMASVCRDIISDALKGIEVTAEDIKIMEAVHKERKRTKAPKPVNK